MTKRPRSSGDFVATYCAALDGLDRDAIARAPDLPENDRRFVAWRLATERLGAQGVKAERLVVDAVARWAGSACRTPISAVGYVGRIARWVSSSGRLSLAAQCATRAGHVLEFLAGLEASGLSARTVAGYRDVIGSWFAWLEHRDLLHRSPVTREVRRSVRVDQAAVRKADGMRQALTRDEAQRVALWALTQAAPVAGLSVLLQATAGLRSCEVARLDRRNLTESEGVTALVVRGKGQRVRRVVLEPVAVAAWRRYASVRANREGALLLSPRGERFTPRQVQRWAKAAAHAVGREREISSHDLRKTAATLLMDAGAPIEAVQRHLGHSSPTLTLRCYVARTRLLAHTTGLIPPAPDQPAEPSAQPIHDALRVLPSPFPKNMAATGLDVLRVDDRAT